MKKLFKFFPVALAVLALTGCSDDLQVADNGQELQFEKGKLYVEVEGNGLTRGGFASAVYENASGVNSLFNALYFEQDDRIKVYCDQSNWRSQVWKLGADQQYLKKYGVAAFEPEDGSDKYVQQSEVAYGIFPYVNAYDETNPLEDELDHEYGWFENERRTEMGFKFEDQAKAIEYSAEPIDYKKTSGGEFTGETVDGTFYKTPFPLWGVKAAGADVMTMKYLTGILRLDFVAPAAASAGKANYLVIVADKRLNGKFAADVDPDELGAKAPTLVGADLTVSYTATQQIVNAGVIAENALLVKLDATAGHKLVYLPLPAQEYGVLQVYYLADQAANFSAKLGAELVDGTLMCDLIGDDLIDTENTTQKVANAEENTVYAGTWYRVVDDSNNINSEASSPFQMVQAIIAADKQAYRDFTLTFTSPILVDNTDAAPQRQWVDFTEDGVANYGLGETYALTHNVTVNVTFNGVADNQVLKIRNIGGKKLTMNVTQGTKKVYMQVGSELASDLVINGTVPQLTNYSNDHLTAKGDGVIVTDGKMTIDRTNTTSQLIIANNCEGVKINNGTVTTLRFVALANNISGTANYTGNSNGCDIHTEGTANIVNIQFDKFATNGATAEASLDWADNCKKVCFTSKLTTTAGLAYGPSNITGAYNGASTPAAITKAVVTALQLKAATTDIRILAKDIDMNEEFEWAPKATAHALNGDYRFYPAASKAYAAANILKATISNLNLKADAGSRGFFKKISNQTVENVIFDNAFVTGAVADKEMIGAVAAEIDGTATINNVNITNLNIAPTASDNLISAGAVFGSVSSTGEVTFTNVTTGGAISAYGNLGGIVGFVDKEGEVTFGKIANTTGTKYKVSDVCAPNVTITEGKVNGNFSPAYATYGQYVGQIETTAAAQSLGKVTINLNNYTETTAPNLDPKAKADFMNTNHETTYHAISMPQNLIGFSGYWAGSTLPISWTAKAAADWYVNVNVFGTDASDDAPAKRIKYYTTLPSSVPTTHTAKKLCTVAE